MTKDTCGICSANVTSKTGGVACTKCNKWFHFTCGKVKYSPELKNTYLCPPCKPKNAATVASPKVTGKPTKTTTSIPNSAGSSGLLRPQAGSILSKSAESPIVITKPSYSTLAIMNPGDSEKPELEPVSQPPITPAPEVIAEEVNEARKTQNSNDLPALGLPPSESLLIPDLSRCITCDIPAGGSPSFECHSCKRWQHGACAAIDADLVLALQKPSGRYFSFKCTNCYQRPCHTPKQLNQSTQISPDQDELSQNPKEQIKEPLVCRFHLRGICRNSVDCPFLHICTDFYRGKCGNDQCILVHKEPCRKFSCGLCFVNDCPKVHLPAKRRLHGAIKTHPKQSKNGFPAKSEVGKQDIRTGDRLLRIVPLMQLKLTPPRKDNSIHPIAPPPPYRRPWLPAPPIRWQAIPYGPVPDIRLTIPPAHQIITPHFPTRNRFSQLIESLV